MTPVGKRIGAAAAALFLLLLGFAGLALRSGASATSTANAGATATAAVADEFARVTEAQRKVGWFFDEGRAAPGDGRGLFETDFFKPPPPPPPPKPKPPAPTTRELPLFYRGLASFADGGRVAYLAVENSLLTLAVGDTVADGWKLSDFDAGRAVLAKEDKTLELPFNRRATLTVPAK